MKIAVAGDWTYQSYQPLCDKISQLFYQCDHILYNFETSINFGGQKLNKAYNFSVEPTSELYLNDKTICHLANNHLCDSGMDNAFATVKWIQKKSKIVGVCSSNLHLEPYTIIQREAESLGIIGCCGWVLNSSLFSFLEFDSTAFWDIVRKLREQVDTLIVSIHWGLEQVFIPSPKQCKLARKAIDFGVDFFVGHHSHVFQPYERYKDKYIFYSIGNFQIPNDDYSDRQSLSNILVINAKDMAVEFFPIQIINANPKLINSAKIKEFYEKFDARFITLKKFIIHSLPMHYRQNWDAWKIRFNKYGAVEYCRYLRFLMIKKNFIGFLLFVIFVKVLKTDYNPVKWMSKTV